MADGHICEDGRQCAGDSRGMFTKGVIGFAGSQDADSRDHHIFISVGKDGYERLGRERFETPIGRITEGLEVLDDLYYGYGELPELYHRLRLEGELLIKIKCTY